MDFGALRTQILSEVAAAAAAVELPEMEQACRIIAAAGRIFLVGEGRSGLVARAFAMRLVHLGYRAHVVGEATTPAIAPGDLLVAITGSGETHCTVHTLTRAAESHAATMAVCSRRESAAGKIAHCVLVVPGATKHRREGDPVSIQPLGSLFDQAALLTLDAMICRLSQDAQEAMLARHNNLE